MIDGSGSASNPTNVINSWKVRVLIVAVVFISTLPYFYLNFTLFKIESARDVFVLLFPWLALVYMAVYWIVDRKISIYLVVLFIVLCAPLVFMAAYSVIIFFLLFPSIWLAIYLVRYHLKRGRG